MKEVFSYRPKYSHFRVIEPPKSKLTLATAFEAYQKLKDYLAIQKRILCPSEGWVTDRRSVRYMNERHLFRFDGFHWKVEWKPKLEEGWERLDYESFCLWYGLKEE
jgi:hypothetical protein